MCVCVRMYSHGCVCVRIGARMGVCVCVCNNSLENSCSGVEVGVRESRLLLRSEAQLTISKPLILFQ